MHYLTISIILHSHRFAWRQVASRYFSSPWGGIHALVQYITMKVSFLITIFNEGAENIFFVCGDTRRIERIRFPSHVEAFLIESYWSKVMGVILSDKIIFIYNETRQLFLFMSFTRCHSRPSLSFGKIYTDEKHSVIIQNTQLINIFLSLGVTIMSFCWCFFFSDTQKTHIWRNS